MEPNRNLLNFKNKYGFLKHPNESNFNKWAKNNTFFLTDLFPTINLNEIYPLDLSVFGNWIGEIENFNNLAFFEKKIQKLQAEVPNKIIAGGYLEKRALYTSDLYIRENEDVLDRRNTHLGIDFWLPENTPVHAILDGEIVSISNDNNHKGYGGLLILKHTTKKVSFFTLYGHLKIDSLFKLSIGNFVKKGDLLAVLGNSFENGDWVPHLHFQVMLSLLDYKNDFPGVAFESEKEIWKSICPNPNLLFKLTNL